jgi:hypothetical protein
VKHLKLLAFCKGHSVALRALLEMHWHLVMLMPGIVGMVLPKLQPPRFKPLMTCQYMVNIRDCSMYNGARGCHWEENTNRARV